jgi:hypothetical protein
MLKTIHLYHRVAVDWAADTFVLKSWQARIGPGGAANRGRS